MSGHPSALAVLDVQQGVVQRVPGASSILPNLVTALAAARRAAVLVCFVGVGFRAGHPEISERNRRFRAIADAGAYVEGDPTSMVHEATGRRADEPLLWKRRMSAFSGNDLDLLLRSAGVVELAVAGLTTSGVVLSTLCDASDRDFEVTVLEDACCDVDLDVHRMLTTKVFPQLGNVRDVGTWVASLG